MHTSGVLSPRRLLARLLPLLRGRSRYASCDMQSAPIPSRALHRATPRNSTLTARHFPTAALSLATTHATSARPLARPSVDGVPLREPAHLLSSCRIPTPQTAPSPTGRSYNVPSTARSLPEAMPTASDLPDGSKQGTTSFDKTGYGGPCPPSGTHHYHFKLYAVDTAPDLASAASVSQLESALQGHVLASGELVGTYSRK